MKYYRYLLFDLDGTLTDSSEGIINSILYSFDKLGLQLPQKEELYKFIGPPLLNSYIEYYGFSLEKARLATDYFHKFFVEKGMFENKLYDGIREMLLKVSSCDRKLILATSKPEVFAEKILQHFDILKYFDNVVGATLDEKRTKKEEVLSCIFENIDISDKSDVVLIGDTKFDAIGAKKLGIDCIGVSYGFGTKEELIENGAVYVAETPEQLAKILL